MNVKSAIQLLIFFLIIIFIYFFIKNTFLKEEKNIVNLDLNSDLNKEKTIKEIKTEKNGKQHENLIEGLKKTCRKYAKEKTGKKPITNINVIRI